MTHPHNAFGVFGTGEFTSAVLIEDDDNTQRHANNAHSVWRDPVGDFGVDALAAPAHDPRISGPLSGGQTPRPATSHHGLTRPYRPQRCRYPLTPRHLSATL